MIDMKKFFMTAVLFFAAAIFISAQNGLKLKEGTPVSVSDPQLEWSQYDEKEARAILTSKGLEIESKKDGRFAYSICELPMNMDVDDFRVDFVMTPSNIDDKHLFGFVFDFENENNFSAVLLGKKNFQIVRFEKGEGSVVHKGMYKLNSKKNIPLALERRGDKIAVAVNDLPLTFRKYKKIENPVFGFIIMDKGKLTGNTIAWTINRKGDSEESTTSN